MPITQDRFISIVNASAQIIDNLRDIYRLVTPGLAPAITNANAALERVNNPEQAAVIRELLSTVQQIQTILIDANLFTGEHSLAIQAERDHFKRYARKNAKAAESQRKARINRGVVPQTEQRGLLHEGLQTTLRVKEKLPDIDDIDTTPVDDAMSQSKAFQTWHAAKLANWYVEEKKP